MMTSKVYKFAGMPLRMHNPHIRRHHFRSIKDIKMKILPYIHIFHVLLGLNLQVNILILRNIRSNNVIHLLFVHNQHIRCHNFCYIYDIKLKILPYINIFYVLLGLNFQVDILILRRMVSKNVNSFFF